MIIQVPRIRRIHKSSSSIHRISQRRSSVGKIRKRNRKRKWKSLRSLNILMMIIRMCMREMMMIIINNPNHNQEKTKNSKETKKNTMTIKSTMRYTYKRTGEETSSSQKETKTTMIIPLIRLTLEIPSTISKC